MGFEVESGWAVENILTVPRTCDNQVTLAAFIFLQGLCPYGLVGWT